MQGGAGVQGLVGSGGERTGRVLGEKGLVGCGVRKVQRGAGGARTSIVGSGVRRD